MTLFIRCLLLALLGVASAARAAPDAGPNVIACDTLVSLRVLMAQARDDHSAAVSRLSEHPGCRIVARERVGEAEQRAMIGGAPFECLRIAGDGATTAQAACAWVMP